MRDFDINPVTKSDYPDPDVIRVGDTYYMCSTTMHFLPGGAILRSYDLANWELVTYIFTDLDRTPNERLELEATNYGAGMWAPSMRYHKGKFYVAFVSHRNPGITFLFTADTIEGPWERNTIQGFYHDCSLLFDDDDRVYIVYGNREIHLLELDKDLKGPKENGLNRIIAVDDPEYTLGYEGSHIYKINGKYYLFMIHWPGFGNKRRTQVCLMADSLESEFTGGDVLDDDGGFFNQGVAQGGIVDTPAGKWYAMLFRDNGAVGRIPVLVPVTWKGDRPVFGISGKVPKYMEIASSRPYYRYENLFTSDNFEYNENKKLKLQWQWNHFPDASLWELLPENGLKITTDKICTNVTHAKNILTQRCMFPYSSSEVTVDASEINEGDVAGITAFQGMYGLIGITKETGDYYLVKIERNDDKYTGDYQATDYMPGTVTEKVRIQSPQVTFLIKVNFEDLKDTADFYYLKDKKFVHFGGHHNLKFRLDHFCGARFGLFIYSTKKSGGSAVFTDFKYHYDA